MLKFEPLFIKSDQETYILWEGIIRGLFNLFKFNFENMGTALLPENKNDIPAYLKYNKLTEPIYFGEKKRVHLNRFYAYNGIPTSYPMANDTCASHHWTYESYHYHWLTPMNYIANEEEIFPFIFDTEENFFMEGCNSTFINDKKYPHPFAIKYRIIMDK